MQQQVEAWVLNLGKMTIPWIGPDGVALRAKVVLRIAAWFEECLASRKEGEPLLLAPTSQISSYYCCYWRWLESVVVGEIRTHLST
jgi:hypothetical protein